MTRAGRKTDAATMLLMVLLILTAAKLLLERLLALMLPHDLHQNTRFLLSMAQEALLIGLPALLMRRGRSARTGTMRLSIGLLLCAAVLGLAMRALVTPLTQLWGNFVSAPERQIAAADSAGEWCLQLLALAVLPAVLEEALFRGVLLGGMKRFPPWAAVLLSGALFSLFHQNPAQTVYQFLFGCVFALVVIKSGSLLPAVFMHVLNNAFIIVYQYLGAEPGETASLILLIAGLIAAVGGITCLLLCKTPPREERERPRYGVFFLYASLGILYCAAMWALTLVAV